MIKIKQARSSRRDSYLRRVMKATDKDKLRDLTKEELRVKDRIKQELEKQRESFPEVESILKTLYK